MKAKGIKGITFGMRTDDQFVWTEELKARWESTIAALNGFLGEAGIVWEDLDEPDWWDMLPPEKKSSIKDPLVALMDASSRLPPEPTDMLIKDFVDGTPDGCCGGDCHSPSPDSLG